MNTDFRALCAELIDALDGWHQAVLETGTGWVRPDETYLIDRARAALAAEPVAEGPAVPEGREPASVVREPSDKELLELMHKSMRDDLAEVSRLAALQAGTDPGVFRVCLNYDVAKFARAVLARFGHHFPDATKMVSDDYQMGRRDASADSQQAAEAAEDEVAELALKELERTVVLLMPVTGHKKIKRFDTIRAALKRLQELENNADLSPAPAPAGKAAEVIEELRMIRVDVAPCDSDVITRAVDLLEQRHPTPVPVSERLPRPGDCDTGGRVWWFGVDTWMLRNYVLIDGTAIPLGTHWLPATALPLPTDAGQSPA